MPGAAGAAGAGDFAPPQTGTTIVAVTYAGGVVLGADSRVSTGTYVSNRASDKITPLTDFVWLLRSGSAADTQAVSDYGARRAPAAARRALARPAPRRPPSPARPPARRRRRAVRYFAAQHEMEVQARPSVATIATLVKTMNYQNKQLVGAMLVAGWDAAGGGQVFGCPIGGTLSAERWATDGSGSTYLWGFLEAEYREGMTRGEAEELVARALALAMARDGSSGGVIRLVAVDAGGAARRWVTPESHPVMWDELPAPVGMAV
jgi:20S proteasome subunit beta 1